MAFYRVYCKFHYMEYQSFDNSEEELLYFVKSFYNKTWDWKVQYKDDISQKDADEEQRACGNLFFV